MRVGVRREGGERLGNAGAETGEIGCNTLDRLGESSDLGVAGRNLVAELAQQSVAALALSGDGRTLAIDAPDEDGLVGGINGPQYSGKENQDTSNGAIYVFVNTNGTWSQQAYIKSSNIRVNDQFGMRLAVSRDGSVLVAGGVALYLFAPRGGSSPKKTGILVTPSVDPKGAGGLVISGRFF